MSERMDRLKHRVSATFTSVFKREKLFVIEKRLTDASFKTEAKIEVNLRLVQRDEFPKIANKFKKFEVNVEEMLEDGDVCAIAEIDGNLVHWTLVAFNDAYVGEIERKIRVSPDSAYLYAGYTAQEYRGLGIASKAMEKILCYLHEIGIRKTYALIRHDNFPSLRYTHKAGFKKIGTIKFFKICKLKLCRYEGETKKITIH